MSQVWLKSTGMTPLGPITVSVSEQGLVGVHFGDETSAREMLQVVGAAVDPKLETQLFMVVNQIEAYLRGDLKQFDLLIDWYVCTEFQQRVLKEVCKIPYGQVKTYAEIAFALGDPKTIRAVGGAVASNPMPMVIPCHRVVAADNKLGGYSGRGGTQTKAWLLKLEGHLLVA